MPADGRDSWATKNVVLPPEVKSRLRKAEDYPREPFWMIVARLLDEHDSAKKPPSPLAGSA